jgi:anti-sigma B factor antagonist
VPGWEGSIPFEIETELRDGAGYLRLSGEFDLAVAPRVTVAAESLLANGVGSLVLDLSMLRFIDSSGLRVIVVLNRRSAEEGWTLQLVRPPQPVLKVFQISGLEEHLNFIAERRE